ncbi:hypothetical protein RND81_14G244500 [Saponaria officinalis]|uniref:Protein kinase domain-containing protein n=1 Tax=Saponaria officinalis TaxID=3572 RepID=A0AAW1GXI9_SAPOF
MKVDSLVADTPEHKKGENTWNKVKKGGRGQKRNPNFTVLSRIQIVADVADGLDYMLNCVGVKLGFVHTYVKNSSVIVCEKPSFVAKLCHFGAAQLCRSFPVLKRVGSGLGKFEGTRDYMASEFRLMGVPTLKSDVFAFGVVVPELLPWEEPIKVDIDKRSEAFKKVLLIHVAREAVGGGVGRLRQWGDRRLRDSVRVEVVEGLARMTLECVQDDTLKKPDIGKASGSSL